jgi:hypothetical protein
MFENIVLKRIFERMSDEGTGDWRKLRKSNDAAYSVYSYTRALIRTIP